MGQPFVRKIAPKLFPLISKAELLRILVESLKQVGVTWVTMEYFRRRCEEIGFGADRFSSIGSCP